MGREKDNRRTRIEKSKYDRRRKKEEKAGRGEESETGDVKKSTRKTTKDRGYHNNTKNTKTQQIHSRNKQYMKITTNRRHYQQSTSTNIRTKII